MPKTVLVFDVDGTLTPARQKIHDDIREFMMKVRERVPVAVVGGSDLSKIVEQLADSQEQLLSQYDYVFSENGLVAFKGSEKYPSKAIQDQIGEERLQKLINFTLRYFSEITLPVKRGNFIEFRKVLLLYFLF